MKTVTTSEIKTYLRCREEHRYAYVQLARPVEIAPALAFGQAAHSALEVWWITKNMQKVYSAIASCGLDRFDAAAVTAMMMAYDARWRDEEIETIGVERTFKVQRNGYVLSGKIDAIAKIEGKVYIVEHKTASGDIRPGGMYWQKLDLDWQVSSYYAGAKALGYDIHGCLYDVLRKPAIRPSKAVSNIRLKKDGEPRAGQRLTDETPEEYLERACETIMLEPSAYLQRNLVVRLRAEEENAHRATDRLVEDMTRDAAPDAARVRTPDACMRYGRMCDYFDVCRFGDGELASEKFRRAAAAHEELQERTEEKGEIWDF